MKNLEEELDNSVIPYLVEDSKNNYEECMIVSSLSKRVKDDMPYQITLNKITNDNSTYQIYDKKETDLRSFNKEEGESRYSLPLFELTKEGLEQTRGFQIIQFVSTENKQGFITESMLSMLIAHLKQLNTGELANGETSLAITKLQEALFWLEERKRDRKSRGVYGTKKA